MLHLKPFLAFPPGLGDLQVPSCISGTEQFLLCTCVKGGGYAGELVLESWDGFVNSTI